MKKVAARRRKSLTEPCPFYMQRWMDGYTTTVTRAAEIRSIHSNQTATSAVAYPFLHSPRTHKHIYGNTNAPPIFFFIPKDFPHHVYTCANLTASGVEIVQYLKICDRHITFVERNIPAFFIIQSQIEYMAARTNLPINIERTLWMTKMKIVCALNSIRYWKNYIRWAVGAINVCDFTS